MSYTDVQLETLLRLGEADLVERKPSASDTGDIRKDICAFANDLPNHHKAGVIFIGVKNDGTCNHIPITDVLLQNLAHLRSDGQIVPFPTLVVQKRVLHGCEMAVIIVDPSDAPPVRYNGRCWIRVGTRRDTASAHEEVRLAEKRRHKDKPFDIRPVETATVADYDLTLFERRYLPAAVAPEIIDENQRTLADQLKGLRMLTPDEKPTVLGCIVLGKVPTNHLPGAYIQFLRIDGSTLSDPIKDEERISGPLPDLLSQLDSKLEAHITTQVDLKSTATEIRRPDYPLVALQQLTRNAVLHRTYESTNAPVRITWFNQRIEIISPGGPYGIVTPETFGQPGVYDYRNPHLAEAMKNLGYVQQFGVGIQTARAELRRNGNPDVVFDVKPNFVLGTLKQTT